MFGVVSFWWFSFLSWKKENNLVLFSIKTGSATLDYQASSFTPFYLSLLPPFPPSSFRPSLPPSFVPSFHPYLPTYLSLLFVSLSLCSQVPICLLQFFFTPLRFFSPSFISSFIPHPPMLTTQSFLSSSCSFLPLISRPSSELQHTT